MAYVYVQLGICVTIFSNSSIILTGFKFTKLHTLTLAVRSYALLVHVYLDTMKSLKSEILMCTAQGELLYTTHQHHRFPPCHSDQLHNTWMVEGHHDPSLPHKLL